MYRLLKLHGKHDLTDQINVSDWKEVGRRRGVIFVTFVSSVQLHEGLRFELDTFCSDKGRIGAICKSAPIEGRPKAFLNEASMRPDWCSLALLLVWLGWR